MITIYEYGHTDFGSMGLGELHPLSCQITEQQGGSYELTLVHPMDALKVYELLGNKRVLRAPAPIGTTPRLKATPGTSVERWTTTVRTNLYLKPSATLGGTQAATPPPAPDVDTLPQQYVDMGQIDGEIWVDNGNAILEQLRPGVQVTLLQKTQSDWYLCISDLGQTGFIRSSHLRYSSTESVSNPDVYQSHKIRNQLFRIYRCEKNTQKGTVTAWARHLYYDLVGNALMDCKLEKVSLAQAFTRINQASVHPNHPFVFHTDNTAARITSDLSHKGMVEAHLDPEEGLLALSNTRMVRDNFDVFFLKRSRVVRQPISYGKNLKGVTVDVSEDQIVNRIIPVGSNMDGEPVYLDTKYVDSPRNVQGTLIRAKVFEYHEAREQEATGDDPGMTLAQVKAKLKELALEEYESGIDLPEITVNVDFLQLGDTLEYAPYQDLDRLYLGDLVRVHDELHGVDLEAEVTEHTFDCLAMRYLSITVGVTNAMRSVGSITSYMLPGGGISGTKLQMGSVDGSRLAYMSVGAAQIGMAAIDIAHIKQAAIDTLSANAITALTAEIERLSAGEITTDALYASLAQIIQSEIGTAVIGFGQVRDLSADVAIIREGMGGKLLIDRLAVSEANMVNLTTGTLIIQGAGGALYQLTVDEQGNIVPIKRMVANEDVKDLSLVASEKIVKNSITANLLNVQEIFANSALIGAIKAINIEAHSIGVSHLNPSVIQSVAENATGQQLVIEFSNGTILDKENTLTVARLRVYHQTTEITHRIPANAVHWERISDNPTADATWNANPAHIGQKSITISGADIDFRGVLRCRIDEVRLYSTPSFVDGSLIMTDHDTDDSLLFSISNGSLLYTGENDYEVQSGRLYMNLLIGSFQLDTTMSNLKTSYISIARQGIELYASGFLNLIAGSVFNLIAGQGTKRIGISNNRVDQHFIWAGAETPVSAPFNVLMDGTVRATKLKLNNSQITEFTQMYVYNDADNADPSNGLIFRIMVPSECSGVQSLKLSFVCEPFRAYSKAALAGGAQTQTSSTGGGGTITSSSGGSSTATSGSSGSLYTTYDLENTGLDTATTTGRHKHSASHRHTAPDHTHTVSISSHRHSVTIGDHWHSVSFAEHGHGIDYGIYQGTTASSCTVHVDGTLVGTYANLTARNIVSHLSRTNGIITRDTWHTVSIVPNRLSRIVAQAFLIAVVGTAQNATL